MKKIVVDTSVLVKWLNQNDEPFVDHADVLLRDAYERKVILFAPELAKYETGKVLLVGKRLSQTESKTALSLLYDLPIEFVVQSRELSKESYAIASAYGLSFNESVFLALAEQKGAIYVTDNVDKLALATGTKVLALKEY